MANFPDTDLEATLQAAFGVDLTSTPDPDSWTWTDLTTRLLPEPISIRRGVAVGAATQQTSFATVTVLNDDGALTPELPTSPHYPYVDLGTPIRLRLRSESNLVDTFTRTAEVNGWGTATSGEPWTPSSSPSAYSTNGTQAQITFPAINVSRNMRSTRAIRDVDVLWDVAVNAVASGAAHEVGVSVRVAGNNLYRIRCSVVFFTTGQVGIRVNQYLNSSSSTALPVNIIVPALTYSGGTMLRARAQVFGDRIRMRVWLAAGAEPSTWHADFTQTADLNITGFNAGFTAGVDVITFNTIVFAGNTNALPIVFTYDNITIAQMPSDRIEGYIADVRPSFRQLPDGSTHSVAQIDIAGVGSLLERQEAPSYSPMRRSIQLAEIPPIAYWSLEDEETSQFGASAFPGGPSMVVTGPAVFAFSAGVLVTGDVITNFGTKPLVGLHAGAKLTAAVPLSTVKTEWAVSCMNQSYVPDVPAVTEIRLMEWDTPGGTFVRWALVAVTAGATYQVRAYDSAGASTTVVTSTTGLTNGQQYYTVEAIQSGGNINVELFTNDASRGTGSVVGTMAALNRIKLNPDRVNTTASLTPSGIRFTFGHVQVSDEITRPDLPHYGDPDTGLVPYASNAWYLETAHGRIKRLCDEARVRCVVLGTPGTTGYTSLNSQQEGSFAPLVAQAVESESGGVLFEAGFGYCYLPRTARYNLPAYLVVDMTTYVYGGDTEPEGVLVPRLDVTSPNSWTVQRANGGTGSHEAPAAYRARRGTIAAQVTVDVLDDEDLPQHASWRTHLTVDAKGSRYPDFMVDLAGNPALVQAWMASTIGSRTQRTNQPTIAGLGTIDQIVDGYTETIGPREWTVAINASPATVWDVGVYDSSTSKWDSASTTLANSPTSSGTSFILSTTDVGDIWSTTPGYSITVDGEDNLVTAMTAASGTGPYSQTATVTRPLVGAKAHTAGAAVHVTTPGTWAL